MITSVVTEWQKKRKKKKKWASSLNFPVQNRALTSLANCDALVIDSVVTYFVTQSHCVHTSERKLTSFFQTNLAFKDKAD